MDNHVDNLSKLWSELVTNSDFFTSEERNKRSDSDNEIPFVYLTEKNYRPQQFVGSITDIVAKMPQSLQITRVSAKGLHIYPHTYTHTHPSHTHPHPHTHIHTYTYTSTYTSVNHLDFLALRWRTYSGRILLTVSSSAGNQ